MTFMCKGTIAIFGSLFVVVGFVSELRAETVKGGRKSFEQIRAEAESGGASAQYQLGLRYYTGDGTAKDLGEATKWFRKAAEQNNADAQGLLGYCYTSGQGVVKDQAEAVKWWRKAADQGVARAQGSLGACYYYGQGVPKDDVEAVKWYRKAAEQGLPQAQRDLGNRYLYGEGVKRDEVEALKWYRKAADQGFSGGQLGVANCYLHGLGITKDPAQAVKWYFKAAEQNEAGAQYALGWCYGNGEGVAKNDVEAYKWCLVAAARGNENAKQSIPALEKRMSREEMAEGQRLARDFRPRAGAGNATVAQPVPDSRPRFSGTGFFITDDGYLITNEHVVAAGAHVRLMTGDGVVTVKVVKIDAAHDLALLKAEGNFTAMPVTSSRSVQLGETVMNIGFPNIDLQGFAPKFARGEIGSLSGPRDDARYFQISVPVQPGNSGGALVDERGNVIGVVSAKLSAKAALLVSGALPENVNYAVKSSFLLSFLESVPEVATKMKQPNAEKAKFEDVVERAKKAAALVVVY